MTIQSYFQPAIYTLINFNYAIGFFSEIIIILIVIGNIYINKVDLVFYIIGLLFSIIINIFLKKSIKDPRPHNPVKFLNSEHFITNSNVYGMPSGHSQHTFYSLFYLLLTVKSFNFWTIIASIICILTIYERWIFNNHTIQQLIGGAILGILIAYSTMYFRNKY